MLTKDSPSSMRSAQSYLEHLYSLKISSKTMRLEEELNELLNTFQNDDELNAFVLRKFVSAYDVVNPLSWKNKGMLNQEALARKSSKHDHMRAIVGRMQMLTRKP